MKCRSLFIHAAIVFILISLSSSRADTLLDNPTEQQFASALAAGGKITFTGDTLISLLNNYSVQKNTIIDAGNRSLVFKPMGYFTIQPGVSLSIVGLTATNTFGGFTNYGLLNFTNCNFTSHGAGPGIDGSPVKGGLIYNSQGTVNISKCSFKSCYAFSQPGITSSYLPPLYGGIIYNTNGDLNITESVFNDNYSAMMPFSRYDYANDAFGGVIYSTGNCTIDQSILNGNSISARSGVFASSDGTASGGAIYSKGKLVISNSTLNNNTTSGNNGGVGGAICASGILIVSNTKFFGNSSGTGGAIVSGNATLDKVDIENNTANSGGGIYNAGTLRMTSSTLAFNSGNGSGEYRRSTSPITQGPIHPAGDGLGGGIFSDGDLFATNSTIFANQCTGGSGESSYGSGEGGAIFVSTRDASICLVHVTLQSNTVFQGKANGIASGTAQGSAIYNSATTAIVIANSIIGGGNAEAVFGALSDFGNNICFDSSAHFTSSGSYNSQDPKLGSFGQYGGFTPVISLLPDSVALDHAYPPFVPAVDQRGVPRDRLTGDIGAFEANVSSSSPPTLNSSNYTGLLPGSVIHLLGASLFYTTNVTLAGQSAPFTVLSDTEISIVVPTFFESGQVVLKTLSGSATNQTPAVPWIELQNVGVTNRNLVVKFNAATNGVTVNVNYGNSNTAEHTISQTINFSGTNELTFGLSNILGPTFVAQIQFSRNPASSQTSAYYLPIPLATAKIVGWSFQPKSATSMEVQVQVQADNRTSLAFYQATATNNLPYPPTFQTVVEPGISDVTFLVANLPPGSSSGIVGVARDSTTSTQLEVTDVHLFSVPGPLQDQSLSFTGTGQFVTVPHKDSLNSLPLTVSAWFKTSQQVGYVGLVSKYDPGTGTGYQVSIIDGALHAFYLKAASNKITGDQEGVSAGAVADGTWHHVDFAVDNLGGKIYLDGVLKTSAPWVGTPGLETSTAPLRFAYYFNDYVGQLDEIELWKKAKTPTEVLNFRNPPDPSDPLLLGYWKFNQGTGTNLFDSSPNKNVGNINGNPTWTVSSAPANRPSTLLFKGDGSLSIAGTVGTKFVIEQSVDLINWTPTSTNQFDVTGFASLSVAPVGPKKFLRLKTP